MCCRCYRAAAAASTLRASKRRRHGHRRLREATPPPPLAHYAVLYITRRCMCMYGVCVSARVCVCVCVCVVVIPPLPPKTHSNVVYGVSTVGYDLNSSCRRRLSQKGTKCD